MKLHHLTDEELIYYHNELKNHHSKRFESNKLHGFDIKFAYNLVRLLEECDQILCEGTLDLMRNKEQLKAIRRGEWTQEQVEDYCCRKEKTLEEHYAKSQLPNEPDQSKIRQVLINCIEHHYGNIEKYIKIPDRAENLLLHIKQLMTDSGY